MSTELSRSGCWFSSWSRRIPCRLALLRVFLHHREFPTQRAGSISVLVHCYWARATAPQEKQFVTLDLSTAMSQGLPETPAAWDAASTKIFLHLDAWWKGAAGGSCPEDEKRQNTHDYAERNCGELLQTQQVFGKGAHCRRPLCGKETNHCGLSRGHLMRHRKSEGGIWCFL